MRGGYFIWLTLPPRLNATALARRCAAEVVIAAGPVFAVPEDKDAGDGMGFEGCVRLCFAWEEEGNLGEGVRRVGVVARAMLDGVDDAGEGSGREGHGRGLDEFK